MGEKYYLFRTYKLYKEGQVNRFTVVMGVFVNTLLGGVVVANSPLNYYLITQGITLN